jgi:hypothetical protein
MAQTVKKKLTIKTYFGLDTTITILTKKWSLHSEIDNRVLQNPFSKMFMCCVQGQQNKQPSETGAGLAHFRLLHKYLKSIRL